MAITILSPDPTTLPKIPTHHATDSSSDDSDGGAELDEMPPAKRMKYDPSKLVTPGETVTDDPQWMR